MNFTVKDPPEYSEQMRMLETSDPDHADVFNALFQQMLNNDVFIKKMADEAAKAMKEMVNSKGAPEGIASLDKDGKIPKEQINLDASDVGAVSKFQVTTELSGEGWYRFASIPISSELSFDVTIDRIWQVNMPEIAHLNISILRKNFNIDEVHFNQLGRSFVTLYITQIRVVHSAVDNKFYFDLYYNTKETNRVFVTVSNVTPVITNFGTVNLTKISDDISSDTIYTYDLNMKGLIADRAFSDGAGNNITETYASNNPKNYRITSNEELENAINDTYINTPDLHGFQLLANMANGVGGLGAGAYYITGYRTNANAGYLEAKSYNFGEAVEPRFFLRSRYNGAWRSWVNVSNFNKVWVVQKQEDMPQTLNDNDTIYIYNAGTKENPIVINTDAGNRLTLNLILSSSNVVWQWDGASGLRNVNLVGVFSNLTIAQGKTRATGNPALKVLFYTSGTIVTEISSNLLIAGYVSGSFSGKENNLLYISGDITLAGDLTLNYFKCNANIFQYLYNANVSNASGRLVDENGQNLISPVEYMQYTGFVKASDLFGYLETQFVNAPYSSKIDIKINFKETEDVITNGDYYLFADYKNGTIFVVLEKFSVSSNGTVIKSQYSAIKYNNSAWTGWSVLS